MSKRKIKDLEINNPRDLAVNALSAFIYGKTLLQDYLNRIFRNSDMSPQDRRFATELVCGTCRRLITIDYVIMKNSNRALRQIDPLVLQILRVGMYQLIYMRTPDFASINETVQQARDTGYNGAGGFVNGILRGTQRKIEGMVNLIPGSTDPRCDVLLDEKTACRFKNILFPEVKRNPEKYLSLAFSYPQWLTERWVKRFGYDQTLKICVAGNSRPGLWLRVNPLRSEVDKLKDVLTEQDLNFKLVDISIPEGRSETTIELLSGMNPVDIPGFDDGHFYIQDWMAQHPAIALNARPGEKILDLCAAPGGKTTHIAGMMNNEGYILAVDTVRKKIELIQENCQRLGVTIVETCKAEDLTAKLESLDGPFDAAIVDVPCSNTGVLARRVEARHLLNPGDVNGNTTLQRELLETAFKNVRSGGRVVYSTCSIESVENEMLIKAFLQDHAEAELVNESIMIPEVEYLRPSKADIPVKAAKDPRPQVINFVHSYHDGGYYAILRKK
ncbi:MAG: 16S rRNA (cytosine(967)-C(5))-methyltransferase RsmB [Sedimentisphaerales bacterium]|nr:16S rRNA (cytosine(967)-C(5))-methyltransferase RsmB [Sedimentisphaerales bacterium]MBN2843063.1 16S rRNA (cytosine(967)-C(5))-methyltransferase RsmB [Sedimentisphaerales bacterium]